MTRIRLGVNVDHVATVRQQRRGAYPDLVRAALACEKAGADSIVCHLREDRRHIQDRDVELLRKKIRTRLNLEMGLAEDVIEAALRVKPDQVTLVPERREELTTEGGLDVAGQLQKVRAAVGRFQKAGVEVSLFIGPEINQVAAARATGATVVELHTGAYAHDPKGPGVKKLETAARSARTLRMSVAAGHGLDYDNVKPVAAIPEIEELNIGFSIVSHALFVGLDPAVREMKDLMNAARPRR